MGRGHLGWTKKISVNEWCLVSCVCIYDGGGHKDRQAMSVDDDGVCVCLYLLKRYWQELDMQQCSISLFVLHVSRPFIHSLHSRLLILTKGNAVSYPLG